MGVFSQMNLEMQGRTSTTQSGIFSKAEELDDARQEAEAEAAKATLAKLTEDSSPPDEAPAEEAHPEEDNEEQKRKEHEEAEAKRKAEWEAKKQAKEEEILFAWENATALDDEALAAASSKRVGDDSERLTRRNMKQCVTEMIQIFCHEDLDLARQVMHPRKNMVNCFRYITRKAKEFVLQEMKDNDIKPDREGYGSDVPDDLCYQWAKEYFFDMEAPEDKDPNEEQFVPKPYVGKTVTSKTKKKTEKKKPEPKKEESKADTTSREEGQLDMFSMLGGETAA
jgi:hypothetical protein